MTQVEYGRLNLSQIYNFKLYFGEIKTGILIEDIKNLGAYYVVKPNQIQAYNSNELDLATQAEKVNLESIVSFDISYSSPTNWNKQSEKNVTVDAKKMIIFGAGASYDFSFDENIKHNDRPPLTLNLFDDIYDEILTQYKGANVLANEILQAGDVERYFQDQWDIIKKHYDPDLLNKIINTQFYLQHLFEYISNKCNNNKRNNYSLLTSMVSKYNVATKEKMLLVSFNYDTLLEKSLESVLQYNYENIEDYIDPSRKILLFKPHGSWNWVRLFKMQMSIMLKNDNALFCDELYETKSNYAEIFDKVSDEIKIKKSLDLFNYKSNVHKCLPQLLIPFTDKDDFVMPPTHKKCLVDNLNQIEEILVIGWKGTEQLFKDLLKTHLKDKPIKITVVNKKDDTIEKVFSDILPNAEWNFEDTFSEYMKHCLKSKDHFFSPRNI